MGLLKKYIKKKKEKFVFELSLWTNAILATELGSSIASSLADKYNKNFDAYDKSIDSIYNATHVGGSQTHHIVDGSHSFLGALEQARSAFQNDSIIDEIINTVEHLGRDAMSVSGINPFFQLNPENFDIAKDWLNATFMIPKSWVNDLMTFNGPELIGSSIGTLALIYNWKKKDVELFIEMTASLGVSSIISANPLLGIVTIVSCARAWQNNKMSPKSKRNIINSGLRGGVPTITLVGISSFVGGPVWVGLLLGLILANKSKKLFIDKKDYANNILEFWKHYWGNIKTSS